MYTQDEIKLWIERAKGFAATNIDQNTCAEIAQAQIEYNKMYGFFEGGYVNKDFQATIVDPGNFISSNHFEEFIGNKESEEIAFAIDGIGQTIRECFWILFVVMALYEIVFRFILHP